MLRTGAARAVDGKSRVPERGEYLFLTLAAGRATTAFRGVAPIRHAKRRRGQRRAARRARWRRQRRGARRRRSRGSTATGRAAAGVGVLAFERESCLRRRRER